MSDIPVKKCTKCERELPATPEYFFRAKMGKFGLRGMCKECLGCSFPRDEYIPPDGYKRCKKCLVDYPATLEFFFSDKGFRDGLQSACKVCNGYSFGIKQPRLPPPPDGMRFCRKCSRTLPATPEYFYRSNTAKSGFTTACRECMDIYANERKKHLDPDTVRAYRRDYYHRNILHFRAKGRDYKKQNPDKVRERNRRWYMCNRDYSSERSRQWRLQNPDKKRKNQHRRDAMKRELPATLTVEQWQQCLEYFDHKCAVCGRPRGLWHTLSQDHWQPLSKGGGYTADNIVPLCHCMKDGVDGCNNSKKDKDAETWLIQKFGKRKAAEILKRIQDYFDSLK